MTSSFIRVVLVCAVIATGSACADNRQSAASPERSTPTHTRVSQAGATTFWEARRCAILAPSELPHGALPGDAHPYPHGDPETFLDSWGTGGNEVVIGSGQEVLNYYGDQSPRFPRTGGEKVLGKDGITRWVAAVGDPPLGQIAYKYLVGRCPYVMWTASGMRWADALMFASRVATRPSRLPMASPSPCDAARTRLAVVLTGSNMSQPFLDVAVTNTGTAACTLKGYPQIEAWGHEGLQAMRSVRLGIVVHHRIYERPDSRPRRVIVQPSDAVFFSVGTITAYEGGRYPIIIDRLAVTLPGMHAARSLPINLLATSPSGERIPVGVTAVRRVQK